MLELNSVPQARPERDIEIQLLSMSEVYAV